MSQLIVFTDLDGTLLDHHTYGWKAAAPALQQLKVGKVPLILCTSKTKAEVLPLAKKLGRGFPFVVENGGAVYVPRNYFPFALPTARVHTGYQVLELGERYQKLIRALDDAAEISGLRVRGFSRMTDKEVAKLCEMDVAAARLARRREFDEPFLIEGEDKKKEGRMLAFLQQRGYRVRRGGRFLHLMGNNDKGLAVSRLIELYRQVYGEVRTVGLGDSANDMDFLKMVDVPVLVARPDGSHDAEVLRNVPGVQAVAGIGPEGWNQAIHEILQPVE